MNKRSTIADIAQAAGVSAGTVSHVLNGNERRVSAATRARVLAVMHDLDYRPNAIARSMARRTTATIGLVVSDLTNPVHSEVIRGVEEITSAAGFQLVLASAPTVEAERAAIDTMRDHQVAGCIFMLYSRPYPSPHLSALQATGTPIAVINRYLKDRSISQIHFDDHGAGVKATEHLLSLGHTQVAALAGPMGSASEHRSAIERHAGWEQALRDHGLVPRADWVIPGEYSPRTSYRAIGAFLATTQTVAEQPTALFVANFVMAQAALKALHEARVRVPQDMAVVCVDDPAQAAFSYPALTTLSLPVVEAGRAAARLVLETIKADSPSYPQQITLGFALHVRESCGGKLIATDERSFVDEQHDHPRS